MKLRKRIFWQCEISCAHRLDLPYESKCRNLHGHNYIVSVEVEGEVLDDGMILDFSIIKRVVKDKYDHKYLNDILRQPTVENLALEIVNDLVELAKNENRKIKKLKVRVWEDKDSYAEVEGEVS